MESLSDIDKYDFITLFEVLEHITNSEDLLRWTHGHANKYVFFLYQTQVLLRTEPGYYLVSSLYNGRRIPPSTCVSGQLEI